jgi:predicted Rossmann-fold nucleotide-binding protein
MLTWAQLGLHKKPIAVLNTNGFYDANGEKDFFLKEVNYKCFY